MTLRCCGRYEGVDQRLLDAYDFEEISVGDVLSGVRPAALILMDADSLAGWCDGQCGNRFGGKLSTVPAVLLNIRTIRAQRNG